MRPTMNCTECGRQAEGNYGWTDGSGELCDTCVEQDACNHEWHENPYGDAYCVICGREGDDE